MLRHLDERRQILKSDFAGQGSLRIFLKELAEPAEPIHKGHTDPPAKGRVPSCRGPSPTVVEGSGD
jgi:hypothetical protein